MSTTPPELLTPFAAFLVAGGYTAYRALDRMTKAKENRSTTEDTISKGQMDLTLSLAQQNKAGQDRLFSIQDTMLKQQQSTQETTNRFSDEISKATLTLAKAVNQMEVLTARQADWSIRMTDWDARIGLFMEHQKTQDAVQSQMLIHIRTVLTMLEMVIATINTLVSTLTPQIPTKEKDSSS